MIFSTAPQSFKVTEETVDHDWLKTLDTLDTEVSQLVGEANSGSTEPSNDEDIVLYKILQGLDYTPMLGM